MDISILILLAVILVAVAVLIGFLLATVFGGKSTEPPPQAKRQGLDHRISFYTDHHLRHFILQINGKTIESPRMLQENERRQLLLLSNALRKWLNLEPAPSTKSKEVTSAEGSQGLAPEPVPKSPGVVPGHEPTLFPELPNAAVPTASAEAPAKKGVADWLAQALQPKSILSEPPKSIAVQVDEILQRKLLEKGWQQRGIRLLELPNKGMVVLIGLDQYATVDDVPDDEIRSLIHASVSEWEAKMYGG